MRVALTGGGEAVDLVHPLLGFGGKPLVPLGSFTNEATKEVMACHDVVGMEQATEGGSGGGQVGRRGDEDTLLGVPQSLPFSARRWK